MTDSQRGPTAPGELPIYQIETFLRRKNDLTILHPHYQYYRVELNSIKQEIANLYFILSYEIRQEFLNELPLENFNKLVFTFIRSIENFKGDGNNQLLVSAQSIHSIVIDIP